jgi:hypothetical protein
MIKAFIQAILSLVILIVSCEGKQLTVDLTDESTQNSKKTINTWKYRYSQLDTNDNLVQQGTVIFKSFRDDDGRLVESASYNLNGPLSSNKFEVENNVMLGSALYDVVNPQTRQTFLQYAPYLNQGFDMITSKTPITNFPIYSPHADYDWLFDTDIKGMEIIIINGKSFNATKIVLDAKRPNGPRHCEGNKPGRLNIEEWYQKETGRYIKEVIREYTCSNLGARLLTQETYELIQ